MANGEPSSYSSSILANRILRTPENLFLGAALVRVDEVMAAFERGQELLPVATRRRDRSVVNSGVVLALAVVNGKSRCQISASSFEIDCFGAIGPTAEARVGARDHHPFEFSGAGLGIARCVPGLAFG